MTETLGVTLLALLLGAPAYAQVEPAPLDEKQIEAAIADLGHDEFARREEATDRLRKGGMVVLPYLREGYRKSRDPEVTVRIRGLAEDLFLEHVFVNQGPPYLGIKFENLIQPPEGAREGQGGFEVTKVLKGHPAAAAGFQPRDIILTFDGEPVREGETTKEFRTRILSCSVGQVVTIEVIQGGERKKLKPKLGKTPEGALKEVPSEFRHPQRQGWEFKRWWEKNFEKPPPKEREAEPEPPRKPPERKPPPG